MSIEIIATELRRLETQLLERRDAPEALASLLADEFVEVGSSGRCYDKQVTLELLRNSAPLSAAIEEFEVRMLAADIALATFIILRPAKSERSQRSSIWRLREHGWQILFHQGTPIAPP